ncbi:MAG: DUF58 domain-containing protein [Rhodoferax sp.]
MPAKLSWPRALQWRRRLREWFESRLPRRDTLLLTQRNVYILPSAPGGMLAATLLVLLLASINYQLNLGYLLTFLLTGAAAVGMHVCHANLRGLTMHLIAPQPTFARARGVFDIELVNERRSLRPAIAVRTAAQEQATWTDVPAQGRARVQLGFVPQRRGEQFLPTLTLQTDYPLGTFRVWTVWRLASPVLVYPAVEAHPPPLPPVQAVGAGQAQRSAAAASGEFEGVRAWRRGDARKLVVWKKVAKNDELVSRDLEHAQRSELWLDLESTGCADLEHRLSRLCAWVLQAEQRGLRYGLRLGGQRIGPGQGGAHQAQCLQALALYAGAA